MKLVIIFRHIQRNKIQMHFHLCLMVLRIPLTHFMILSIPVNIPLRVIMHINTFTHFYHLQFFFQSKTLQSCKDVFCKITDVLKAWSLELETECLSLFVFGKIQLPVLRKGLERNYKTDSEGFLDTQQLLENYMLTI